MKVLVYSARPYDKKALKEIIGDWHELSFREEKLSIETAGLANGYDAVALFTSDDASAPVLEVLHDIGVRYIALRSVGYDHVDLPKAESLGIQVANVPEYSPYSVAEHAVAMMMAANRKLIEAQKLMELQDYRLDTLTGFDVFGKTVGVIGTGKIGMAFCRIMSGFGAKVIAFDPIQNAEALALGVTYVGLEELLRTSDIISIHCPLNAHTKYLFSARQFELMKDHAVLINTSRGGIVNTADLITFLRKGKFTAVCLDVYEKEKGLFFNDHRRTVLTDEMFIQLRSFRNVLITGHQGFLTHEALRGIATTTFSNLQSWAAGTVSQNELTKPRLEKV